MTLGDYQVCLNLLGEAGHTLARAKAVADQPGLTNGVIDAFELARLALHQCMNAVGRQAVLQQGWDATVAAIGDPVANLRQQEREFWDGISPPYWPIAGAASAVLDNAAAE